MLHSHNPSFPKKGNDLDFETYYRMKPDQQQSARDWLTKNGTEDQKEAFRVENERFEKENAQRAKQEEAQQASLKAQRRAPHKHGQTKGGGCNIS
jgi:hypothetical protein